MLGGMYVQCLVFAALMKPFPVGKQEPVQDVNNEFKNGSAVPDKCVDNRLTKSHLSVNDAGLYSSNLSIALSSLDMKIDNQKPSTSQTEKQMESH